MMGRIEVFSLSPFSELLGESRDPWDPLSLLLELGEEPWETSGSLLGTVEKSDSWEIPIVLSPGLLEVSSMIMGRAVLGLCADTEVSILSFGTFCQV